MAGRELPLGYTYSVFVWHVFVAVAGRELPLGLGPIRKKEPVSVI